MPELISRDTIGENGGAPPKAVFPGTPEYEIETKLPFSFDYDGKPAPLDEWESTLSVTEEAGYEVVTRRFTAPNGFAAECVTKVYDKEVFDYTLHFLNTGKENTRQVTNVNALDMDVDMRPRADLGARTDFSCHWDDARHYTGDEIHPILHLMKPNYGCAYPTMEEMAPDFRILRDGNEFATESTSCTPPYAPYFDMNTEGVSFALAVGWTGRWKIRFVNHGGTVHINAGMARGDFYLKPGENVRTCRIMYVRQTGDPENACNAFRRAFIRYIAPRHPDGTLWFPPVATPCTKENATDGANEINWVKNVLDNTDTEYYWLDAWWHVGGFPAGMGNYTFPIEKNVDPVRFSQGMRIFGEICRDKNYGFLLWFAPETYPETCTMAQEHPEFLLHRGNEKGGSLNLTDPAAFDYAVRYFTECIREYGVSVFRTDSGFDLELVWENEEAGRQGVLEMQYVDGLYRFWDTLERETDCIVDNCCGGGTRLDLEMCSRSICMWRTDSSVWYSGGDQIRAANMNQTFTVNFDRFIPWHVGGMFDYDPYTVRSSYNGGLTVNMRIDDPDFDKAELRRAVAEAKRLRRYITGDFYPLLYRSFDHTAWCAYQYHVREKDEGCAFIFRRHHSPYGNASVSFRGVDPCRRYAVDFYYGYDKAKTVMMYGRELQNLSVSLEGAPASLLIEYHYREDFIRK